MTWWERVRNLWDWYRPHRTPMVGPSRDRSLPGKQRRKARRNR